MKADIYFLLDESGSISYDEFDDMKNFTKKWLESFEVGNNHVRFGLVKFASSATTVFRLHDFNTKADIENAVNALDWRDGALGLIWAWEKWSRSLKKQYEHVGKRFVSSWLSSQMASQ